jgi:hypothetical protein
MKKEFTPYLKDILPPIFKMAILNPEMSISGVTKGGNLEELLSEV